MRRLTTFGWPGNVRELENELERAFTLAAGAPITERHLSRKLRQAGAQPAEARTGTLAEQVADTERRVITETLRRTNGNLSEVARLLGVTRTGLRQKMERLKIRATQKRGQAT
jgi:DNA-binding NtrC family response regulator